MSSHSPKLRSPDLQLFLLLGSKYLGTTPWNVLGGTPKLHPLPTTRELGPRDQAWRRIME